MRLYKERLFLFLCLGLLLLVVSFGQAQSYMVDIYKENDGLPSSIVYDAVQDRSGRMWFVTRGGMCVYDGHAWRTYTVVDGLPAQIYAKIRLDEEGTIWALPDGHEYPIMYFTKNKWYSLKLAEFYNLSTYTAFEVMGSNGDTVIAIGTFNTGLLLYQNERWVRLTVSGGLHGNRVNGIAKYQDCFYVATDKGLSIIKGREIDNSFSQMSDLPSGEIAAVAVEEVLRDPKIWLLGRNWVGYIKSGRFHMLSKQLKLKHDIASIPLILEPDHEGGVFCAGSNEVYHVHGISGETEYLGRKSGLVAEGATSLFIDREKNLWITNLRGVSKIPSLRFANYNEALGLSDDEVTALIEYEPGKFLFGHHNYLTYFDGQKFNIRCLSPNSNLLPAENRVYDIKVDSHQNIWVAASSLGLAKLDPRGRITWYREKSGLQGQVNSVLIDHSGTVFVTTDDSLFARRYDHFEPIAIPYEGFTGFQKIFLAPDDTKYFATSRDGIYHLEDNEWKNYRVSGRKEANEVYSVLIDSQNRVWVGTLAGLYILEDQTLRKFAAYDLEIDRPVFVIVEDLKGRIWLGTNNGVIRWDGKKSQHFTIKQGFVGQETNRAAALVDTIGRVWFGSDLGVSCYREEYDFDQIDIPPLIELVALDVSGEIKSMDQVNSLSAKTKILVFHFNATSFINEKAVRYRSRLKGFDEDWMPEYQSESRQIRYTNLPPGRYQFQIQAKNVMGVWSEVISSADIIIKKPIWKEWWFFPPIVLMLVVIGLGILKLQLRRIASREEHLKEIVRERTLQLQDANEELERLIIEDELTGLYNHRRFTQFCDHEWKRALRTGGPLSIILVDIDHFKLYNDSYGHVDGDNCLRRVAQTLQESGKRVTDMVARWGGEEFVFVLSETAADGALCVAEKARQDVENLKMLHQLSPISHYVTISLGCATMIPQEELNFDLLIKAADRALYLSKKNGRNRTTQVNPTSLQKWKEKTSL